MSSQYPPGGVLFPNDRRTNDRAPDMVGSIEVDHTLLAILQAQLNAGAARGKLDLAAWRKQKNGKEFLSMRLSEPYRPNISDNQQSAPAPQQPSSPPSIDDDIPF